MKDIANLPLYQSNASYQATLCMLSDRVENKLALTYYDDCTIGAKNTECSHGLCDDTIEESQDGIYKATGQHCPHDSRYFTVIGTLSDIKGVGKDPVGCFYSCRIFSPNTEQERDQDLIDIRLRAVCESNYLNKGE